MLRPPLLDFFRQFDGRPVFEVLKDVRVLLDRFFQDGFEQNFGGGQVLWREQGQVLAFGQGYDLSGGAERERRRRWRWRRASEKRKSGSGLRAQRRVCTAFPPC